MVSKLDTGSELEGASSILITCSAETRTERIKHVVRKPTQLSLRVKRKLTSWYQECARSHYRTGQQIPGDGHDP